MAALRGVDEAHEVNIAFKIHFLYFENTFNFENTFTIHFLNFENT